jgi:signal transduction histidine kinase
LYYYDNGIKKFPTIINTALNVAAQIDSKLILGTNGNGLLIYENGKTTTLTLNNTIVNSIKVYQDSILFCATNQGVICLKKQNDSFVPYYNYTQKDGLKSIHTNGVETDRNNNIYITTKKGITKTKVILPKQVLGKLEEIIINNLAWDNKKIEERRDLKFLNNSRTSLLIDFDAIYFDVKPNLTYAYRFLGTAEDFRPLPNGQVLLNGLSIGKYELELRVSVPFTESISKQLNFEIKARWFESKGFIILMIALGILLIYLIIKSSIKINTAKRMQNLEKEAVVSNFKLLALRSQMNPHFVFNSLNAIQYYITENQNELSEKYLLSFAKLVRQFFDLSEVSEIYLNKEIELLTNYLDLEKMRFEDKLDFKIEVDKNININIREIPSMLLQPIVENAINHGIFHKESFGLVTIKFTYISAQVYCVEVRDDGIGVENSKLLKTKSMQGHKSKSSQIISERIALLNKTKEWTIDYKSENSTNDKIFPGTVVSINIKYNDESDTD